MAMAEHSKSWKLEILSGFPTEVVGTQPLEAPQWSPEGIHQQEAAVRSWSQGSNLSTPKWLQESKAASYPQGQMFTSAVSG